MNTDIEKNDLFGKVKQVIQNCYEASGTLDAIVQGSAIDDYHRQSYIQKYNEQGNLMEVKRGEGGTNVFFKYDEDGEIIEENIFNLANVFLMKYSYKYDENGNMIELVKSFPNGNLFNNFIYKYDGNGNMTEGYTEKNRDAGILSLFKYNDNGKMIEVYNIKGELVSKYDPNGNEIEHYEYYQDKKYNSKTIKTYDEKGNMTESHIHNYLGELIGHISRNTYDEKDNLTENCEYNQDGSLDIKISYKYEYDNQNNWIKQIELRNYKYGNDKQGNWGKTELHFPEPVYIIRREIEYWN